MISDGRVPGNLLRRVRGRTLAGGESRGAAMGAGSARRGVPTRATAAKSGECGGSRAGEGALSCVGVLTAVVARVKLSWIDLPG